MRPFAWFLFGALAGIVGTVMVYSLNPIFRGDEGETAGGGNVRLVLDVDAVASLAEVVAGDLARPMAEQPQVSAEAVIQTSGLIELQLQARVGDAAAAEGSVTFDPEIVDGTLVLDVNRDGLPGLVDAQALAEGMARRLDSWFALVTLGRPYRVVAIATVDGRFAIELAFTD